MGVPGTTATPIEAMDRNKRRGTQVALVVFFSLVLFVGMTKIHAAVAGCDDDETAITGEYEQEVGTRRMLSSSELAAEAGRRELLEAEARRFLASSYYSIGYASLSASRVSCPPRSGRSYYTRNCQSASGPARPYSRGCSRISRCARDSG